MDRFQLAIEVAQRALDQLSAYEDAIKETTLAHLADQDLAAWTEAVVYYTGLLALEGMRLAHVAFLTGHLQGWW